MRSSRLGGLLSLVAVAVVAAVAGCGSGSDGGAPQPPDGGGSALPPVGQRAEDHVNAVLADTTGQVNLTAEATWFADYHRQYPSDPVGTLGYSVTRVGAVIQDLSAQFAAGGDQLMAAGSFRSAVRWVTKAGPVDVSRLALSGATGHGVAPLRPSRSRAYTPTQVADAIKTQALPALRDAIGVLEPLMATAGVILTFTDDGQEYVITAQEVRAYRAALRLVLAFAATTTAYSWDAGTFDWNRDAAQLDLNQDGILTPQEYLPGGSFLVLTVPSQMPEALSALDGALADAKAVATSMGTSTPDPRQLLAQSEEPVDWSSAAAGIGTAQIVLTGPVSVPVSYYDLATQSEKQVSTQVNPRALWTNPPADLKALMPTLGYVVQNGYPVVSLHSIPDKTLNGILPNGNQLPQEFWDYWLAAAVH